MISSFLINAKRYCLTMMPPQISRTLANVPSNATPFMSWITLPVFPVLSKNLTALIRLHDTFFANLPMDIEKYGAPVMQGLMDGAGSYSGLLLTLPIIRSALRGSAQMVSMYPCQTRFERLRET